MGRTQARSGHQNTHGALIQPPDPDRSGVESVPVLLCYPTFCHQGPEFFVYSQNGGLVSPSEFASVIGGIFPIALCGRSSL